MIISWKEMLESLRWKEDDLIVNSFGEEVYLKPCYDENGKRIGITECCYSDDPCKRHKEMKNGS